MGSVRVYSNGDRHFSWSPLVDYLCLVCVKRLLAAPIFWSKTWSFDMKSWLIFTRTFFTRVASLRRDFITAIISQKYSFKRAKICAIVERETGNISNYISEEDVRLFLSSYILNLLLFTFILSSIKASWGVIYRERQYFTGQYRSKAANRRLISCWRVFQNSSVRGRAYCCCRPIFLPQVAVVVFISGKTAAKTPGFLVGNREAIKANKSMFKRKRLAKMSEIDRCRLQHFRLSSMKLQHFATFCYI